MALLLLLQWFSTTLADRQPHVLMSGTWISCPTEDGYDESGIEFALNGRPTFSLHMGPRDEWALFAGAIPPVHVEHGDRSNKLGPAYHYGDLPSRSGRNWSSAELGVRLNVIALPPSDPECYSFAVRVEKDPSPTWANR